MHQRDAQSSLRFSEDHMVSTMASGNVAPWVDTSDITMMYSVTDIMGLNPFMRRILARIVILGQHHYEEALRKAAQMAGEEFAKTKSD